MKVELFLDEGEEYPQLFSAWRVDQETGHADLTTRRNYVDDRKGWDLWRDTDDKNIRLKAENAKLRELITNVHEALCLDKAGMFHEPIIKSLERDMRELGIEVES